MNKKTLEHQIEAGYTLQEICDANDKAMGSVLHWMKKYNLKTKQARRKDSKNKCCPRCNTDKPKTEFYARRGKPGASSYCKVCTTEETVVRQRRLKLNAVAYKGGKCNRCGYAYSTSALEFHHLDPKEKDFAISKKRAYGFDDTIKAELDKTELLCSNCHKEEHEKWTVSEAEITLDFESRIRGSTPLRSAKLGTQYRVVEDLGGWTKPERKGGNHTYPVYVGEILTYRGKGSYVIDGEVTWLFQDNEGRNISVETEQLFKLECSSE